jgi:exodeoxyribonuclease VII large subunit
VLVLVFLPNLRLVQHSAAAMMATPDRLELLTKLSRLHTNLLQQTQQSLANYQYQLEQLNLKIPKPNQQLNVFSQRLDGLHSNLARDG